MDSVKGTKSVFPEAQVEDLQRILKAQYSPSIALDDTIEFGEELIGLLEALATFEEPVFDHEGMIRNEQRP